MTIKFFLILATYSPFSLHGSIFDAQQEAVDRAVLKRKVSELRASILEEKRVLPSESIVDTAAEITFLKKRVQSYENFYTRIVYLYPQVTTYGYYTLGFVSGILFVKLLG